MPRSRSGHRLQHHSAVPLIAAGLALAGIAFPARAGAIDARSAIAAAQRCHVAVVAASHATGVPFRILAALADTEAALDRPGAAERYPWPWTLNVDGRGYHFRTREAAATHLAAVLKAGVTNVDIGCLQINWRWHGGAFPAPGLALDPLLNARYAAGYLRALRAETGSWAGAVAAYHSRDPERGALYRCRVARALFPAVKARDCA